MHASWPRPNSFAVHFPNFFPLDVDSLASRDGCVGQGAAANERLQKGASGANNELPTVGDAGRRSRPLPRARQQGACMSCAFAVQNKFDMGEFTPFAAGLRPMPVLVEYSPSRLPQSHDP